MLNIQRKIFLDQSTGGLFEGKAQWEAVKIPEKYQLDAPKEGGKWRRMSWRRMWWPRIAWKWMDCGNGLGKIDDG